MYRVALIYDKDLGNYNKQIQLTGVRKPVLIADVAVTKRHQQLDEIRIIFTRLSSKSCF